MKRDIQISVLGIQNTGSEPEAILTKTTGTYCFEMGFTKSNTVNWMKMEPPRTIFFFFLETEMRLSKSGSIAGQFLFIPGKKTTADYLMPFGKIAFEVETEFYHLDVKEDELNVQLKYRLYTGNQLFSVNTLTIQICEDGFGLINKTRRNHL